MFDVEYSGLYPEEVGANETVGEAVEVGETVDGETVGSMLIEGNAVGASTELPE